MSEENSSEKPKRRVRRRVHHSEEIWAQARRDYLAGATASAVSQHYGMSVDAIRKRASKQGWCKAHHLSKNAPAPLTPFPDAEEASRIGAAHFESRWLEVAHPAQLAPASTQSGGAWSTWLFQGGRGAGKTRAGTEWLAARAERVAGLYALVGPT